MNVSAANIPSAPVASANAPAATRSDGMAPALAALDAANTAQADLVETLLSIQIQNQSSAQQMQIAGQIIDAYA